MTSMFSDRSLPRPVPPSFGPSAHSKSFPKFPTETDPDPDVNPLPPVPPHKTDATQNHVAVVERTIPAFIAAPLPAAWQKASLTRPFTEARRASTVQPKVRAYPPGTGVHSAPTSPIKFEKEELPEAPQQKRQSSLTVALTTQKPLTPPRVSPAESPLSSQARAVRPFSFPAPVLAPPPASPDDDSPFRTPVLALPPASPDDDSQPLGILALADVTPRAGAIPIPAPRRKARPMAAAAVTAEQLPLIAAHRKIAPLSGLALSVHSRNPAAALQAFRENRDFS